MDGKEQREEVKNPRAKANILSVLTYAWILPIFRAGYHRDLEASDLFDTLKEHTSGILGAKITQVWGKELEQISAKQEFKKDETKGKSVAKEKRTGPSLLKVLIKVFGGRTLVYGILLAIGDTVLKVGQPLLLAQLLRYFISGNNSTSFGLDAYLFTFGIVLCSALNLLVIHPYMMAILHMGMKMRVACCSLIYRKALKLSKTALGETTIGQAVNLLSNDVNRFDVAIIFVHYLWIGPLQAIIITYLLYIEIGISALVGIIVLLLFIPLQAFLAKRSSVLRLRTAIRTDERVRLTNEIITGIQAIKMYTWEKPFGDLIEKARKREIKVISAMSYIRGVTLSFIMFTTRLSVFFTIITYILLGQIITADKVFMLTAYYNSLRQTMTVFFPQGITQLAEVMVSIKRLQNFMMFDEAKSVKHPTNKESEVSDKIPRGCVRIKEGSAKWLENAEENTLSSINLRIEPGELIAVVGQVGSGKSSLLHVILREMSLNSGSIEVGGRIAYASQEPWLFAGSVRQNILFGREMDNRKYDRVVKVCQLRRDFTLFPYGDRTVVGERGVSLSGGQRARINLARAVYAAADVYLMDDPLSAVDAHVGNHMFEECIAKYLNGKTRILVTHQLQFLNSVDRIIVLKDGAIQAQGTYHELQNAGLDFGQLLESIEESKPSSQPVSRSISRQSSISSVNSIEIMDVIDEKDSPTEVEEGRSSGSVEGKVYGTYLRAGGNWCIISTVIMLLISSQLFASTSDYFISWWLNVEEQRTSDANVDDGLLSSEVCIYIYTGLVTLTIVLSLTRSFAFFRVCMTASKRLHDTMFRGISRATMRFFNTNSSGRILNRFSKDMGAVDELLPTALIDSVQIGLGLVGIIIVVGISSYWLLIPTFLIGVLFYYFRVFYLATSRSVKRLEGVTRSPVFAHLNATLQGLTTIRAFEAGEILTTEFDHHQDLHSSAWYLFIVTGRAFGFWLDFVCVIYIALVSFSFLVIPGNKTGGDVGLAITQSLGLTGMFQWGMRQSAELENQMTSVERISEYSVIDQEPPLESAPDKKPPSNWPSEGKIEFREMSMQYGPEEPLVLKNLSFVVQPHEKVGIVGRTGAGKSSLVSALFRLAYMKGEILIDGVEASKLGLHDLRSKISIIPQEPFLFSGSLRRNLDPFYEYPDDPLWQALEEVELKEMGLDLVISEGGSNLSVGQRQLVCLARAIVRNNPILILDEATANVDPHTDELIQKTIRSKFAKCTVLTVAHRLNTVMDSDKVLVMDAGTVVEFDHPHILLQKEGGYLREMVEQTGRSMAESLALVAESAYKSSKIEADQR